jgi:hypothetical protein
LDEAPDTDFSKDIAFTYDQLDEGSCVFNACGMAVAHILWKDGQPFLPVSRNAPYYYYRKSINQTSDDTGSSGYDYCGIVRQYGIAPETLWPYMTPDEPGTTFATEPSDAYNAAARSDLLIGFYQIDVSDPTLAIDVIRGALHQQQHGLPIGIQVPASFMSDAMAQSGSYFSGQDLGDIQGGHEVYVVGSYRDPAALRAMNAPEPFVRILNSWGDWGRKGLNGLRGYVDVGEPVLVQLINEANVISKMQL